MRETWGYAIAIKNIISNYATSTVTKPFVDHKFEVKLILDPTAKYNLVVNFEKLSSLYSVERLKDWNRLIYVKLLFYVKLSKK